MNRIASILLAVALFMSGACTSAPLVIQREPVRSDEKVLGEGFGSSTGIMLLQFIPNQAKRSLSGGIQGGTREQGRDASGKSHDSGALVLGLGSQRVYFLG